jgi:hypothetical protein
VGHIRAQFTSEADHTPVWEDYVVLPANVFDSLIGGTDYLEVDTMAISGDTTAADNAELDYDGTGYAKANSTIGTATTIGSTGLAAINAEVVDVVNVDTFAELTSVPSSTPTLSQALRWLYILSRNKVTQTATTQTLRNNADGATVGTSEVSDNGTTFTRAKWDT